MSTTTTKQIVRTSNPFVVSVDGDLMTEFANDANDRWPCRFKAQKAARLLNAYTENGIELWETLHEFAESGIVQTCKGLSASEYKGHPMVDISLGAGDQMVYHMNRGDAGRIVNCVIENEDAVVQALGIVAGTADAKLGPVSKPQKGRTKNARGKAGIRKENITAIPTQQNTPVPPAGRPVTADPNSAEYRAGLLAQITELRSLGSSPETNAAIERLRRMIVASLNGQLVIA